MTKALAVLALGVVLGGCVTESRRSRYPTAAAYPPPRSVEAAPIDGPASAEAYNRVPASVDVPVDHILATASAETVPEVGVPPVSEVGREGSTGSAVGRPPSGPAASNGAHREPAVPPYVIVKVFYATDRKPVRSLEDWRTRRPREGGDVVYYGADWQNSLELGTCAVSIPTRVHEVGAVERPRFWEKESVEKHLSILTIEPTSSTNYFGQLRARIEKSDERDAFVFVHGYNVTFAQAMMRTAQIAHDVGFKGAPILYSWPSAGAEKAYLRDEESVKLTVRHLKGFLDQIIAQGGPRKLHLVAHSMGNRVLTEVLAQFAEKPPVPEFNEIILAAPDVNQQLFLSEILPAMRGIGKRITLYASSDDVPLKLSRKFHDFPRAGEGLPHLVVAEGLDTIDASGIDTDMLGHSYFAQARRVLNDLARVICQSHLARERDLVPVELAGKPYWRIK